MTEENIEIWARNIYKRIYMILRIIEKKNLYIYYIYRMTHSMHFIKSYLN